MARKRVYVETWETVAYLDADYAASWGCFKGYNGPVDFECESGSIRAHIRHDHANDELSLFYLGRDSSPVSAAVSITRLDTPFGGGRAYFRAPCCGRLARRLALMPQGVRCKTCGLITHRAKRETPTQRAVRKATRLAGRLQCANWYTPPLRRPARMWPATFDRLCEQHAKAVERAHRLLAKRLSEAVARGGEGALIDTVLRSGL